jgi:hypothetical protein
MGERPKMKISCTNFYLLSFLIAGRFMPQFSIEDGFGKILIINSIEVIVT